MRLNNSQRGLFAEKVLDLGHIIFGALVIGQLVSGAPWGGWSWGLLAAGVTGIAVAYWLSCWLTGNP